MPINDFAFSTAGDWDSVAVLAGGVEWDAARRFFVELKTFDENDGDGGIDEGGTLTAEVTYIDPNDPESLVTAPIFPGRFSVTALGKPEIVIENIDPDFEFLQTKVWMDGLDITDRIVSMKFDINALDLSVVGWIKYTDEIVLGIPNVVLLYIL